MLGDLTAESGSVTITRFRTRRVALLLAYLAHFRDRSHSRDELSELLWPELEPERAKRNLRQALSSLRHHLEPPGTPTGAVLDAQQSRVRIHPEHVTTDVQAFRQAIERGEPEKAISLYRGDFLPGQYEDWVLQERLYLEDEYVAALKSWARLAEREERFKEALRLARLALAKDEFDDDLQSTVERLQSTNRTARREVRAEIVTPPPPSDATTVKLPVVLTRYFGRDRERANAFEALAESQTRLLTLTGPAGTGKTRLSVETARVLATDRSWNVWFVPLADVSEGDGLLDAVSSAVQARVESASALEAVAERLAEGRNLLVLDNLEHILEAATPWIAAMLAEVPNVSLLVTSRQSLRIDGEREIDLGTLPVPKTSDVGGLADLALIPSVALFLDRARAALPDFSLTAHNAAAIGDICRTLDGLPLALEIAAGLVGAFSPSQLLQNLDSRLELLRSRRRDLSERHRTLRAAIEYSYNLLDEPLQRTFVALSIFRGGFTVDAAASVCRLPSRGEALGRILDLQERSLLHADEEKEGAPPRFRLLESYREFAAELLDPGTLKSLKRRHAEHYLAQIGASPRPEDRDNRIAALRFLHAEGSISECLNLLLTFDSFSFVAEDVVNSLERDPGFDTFSPLDQARILRLATDAHLHRSNFEQAYLTGQRARDIAQAGGEEEERRLANRKLALVLAYLGRREESIALSEENLAEGEERGDLYAVETAWANIGSNYWSLGNLQAARRAYEGSYAASLELRQGRPYWAVIYNLALTDLDLGNLDTGLELANEGLRIAQADDEAFGVSMCLALISRYHRYKGDFAAALSISFESLSRRRKLGFQYWTFQAIFAHAVTLMAAGQLPEAVTLLAASRPTMRLNGREYSRIEGELRNRMTPAEFERAWAAGLGMGTDEAFRLASRFR